LFERFFYEKEKKMNIKIETRNLEITPEWQERIEKEIQRLKEQFPGVIHHLRCTIFTSGHQRLGLFELSLAALVPGDMVVVKQTGEFVHPLLVEGFTTLNRRLKEYNKRRQQLVKQHEGRPVGIIVELVPMEDYGRIDGVDGSLVYFHRNSVKDIDFDELQEGDFVEYGEEMGDKGPQATWVVRK
jgi:cold shock CspA family protein/ribosome-associated translation inhibitor RaiA